MMCLSALDLGTNDEGRAERPDPIEGQASPMEIGTQTCCAGRLALPWATRSTGGASGQWGQSC